MSWTVGSGLVGITHPFVTFNFVGASSVGQSKTLLPLPTDTRVGDLLLVCVGGRYGLTSIPDSRITTVFQGTGAGGWPVAFGVGYSGPKDYQPPADPGTGVLPPLAFRPLDIRMTAGTGGIDQFTLASCFAIRGQEVDGRLREIIAYDPQDLHYSEDGGDIPAIDRIQSGSLALNVAYGGIGGSYSGWSWSRSPDYTFLAGTDASYITMQVGRSTNRKNPQTKPPTDGLGYYTQAFSVGIRAGK